MPVLLRVVPPIPSSSSPSKTNQSDGSVGIGQIFLADPDHDDAQAIRAYFTDRGYSQSIEECPDLSAVAGPVETMEYLRSTTNIVLLGNQVLDRGRSNEAAAGSVVTPIPPWLSQAADTPAASGRASTATKHINNIVGGVAARIALDSPFDSPLRPRAPNRELAAPAIDSPSLPPQ